MGNSLESEKFFSDGDNGDEFCLVGTVCKENSSKCEKQALKLPGEAPIFGRTNKLSERHVNVPVESEKIFKDEDKGDTFYVVGTVCKENSSKCEKQAVKSLGEAPISGRKNQLSKRHVNVLARKAPNRALSQVPVTSAKDSDSKTSRLSCSQPISERPSNDNSRVRSSSKERETTPAFDARDKMFWYREHKHQKGIVRRLSKDLERSKNKLRKISKEIKVLSDMV